MTAELVLTPVQAVFSDCTDPAVIAKLHDYWSYFSASARWSAAYRQWLEARASGDYSGGKLPGWDGRIRMMHGLCVPAGLFRATYREAQTKLGIRFAVTVERPHVVRWDPSGMPPARISTDCDYSYQDECIAAMVQNLYRGGGIVLCATGTGKTYMAARFLGGLTVPGRLVRCLFIVDTLHLLSQSAGEISAVTGEPVGLVGDSRFTLGRITVATIQTLDRHRNDPVFRQWFGELDVVIADELHEALNSRNRRITRRISATARYGMTATLELHRAAVRMTAYAFAGPVIYRFPLAEGVRRKVLTQGHVLQVLFPPVDPRETDQAKLYAAEVTCQPEKRLFCGQAVRYLATAGRYVMTLTHMRCHTESIARMLTESGIRNEILYGGVPLAERVKIVREFEQRDKPGVLVASGVMKKGVSVNRISAIIGLDERRSVNDIQQKFGRGVRKADGKHNLVYIDVGTRSGPLGVAATRRANALRKLGIDVKAVLVADAREATAALTSWLSTLPQ